MALKEGTEKSGSEKMTEQEKDKLILELQQKYEELKKNQPQMGSGFDLKQFAEVLAEGIAKGNSKSEIDYSKGIKDSEIPIDDYDEKGVMFCVPSAGYVITDDVRKGYRVVLPWNKEKIFFEHFACDVDRSGKEHKQKNFSVYRSHSKKEIEWLRGHKLFGIKFFENSKEAITSDAMKITRMARIMQMLDGVSTYELFQRAKDYNLPVNGNDQELRVALAKAMTDAETEAEVRMARARDREAYVAALNKGVIKALPDDKLREYDEQK